MTTILAVQGDTWAVVGSDSLVSDDNGRAYDLAPGVSKIAEKPGYIIATAGDLRAINIVCNAFDPPKPPKVFGPELDRFFTMTFIPALRDTFERYGYATRNDKEQAAHGSSLIVAVRGTVYAVDEDYAWTRDRAGFYSAGSGGDYAIGAINALCSYNTNFLSIDLAEAYVEKSIEIATKLDTGSRLPARTKTQTLAPKETK